MTKIKRLGGKSILAITIAISFMLTLFAWGIGAGANKNTMNYGSGDTNGAYSLTEESISTDEMADNVAQKATSHVVTKNVSLNIETVDYEKTTESIDCKVKELYGYISSSDENVGNAYNNVHKYAFIVAEIPTEKLDTFLNYISSEFTVTEKHISINDITSDYVETESTLEQLKVQRDTLLSLMGKATSLGDIIEIQDKLTSVNSEIQYYENMMDRMKNDVEYTSVAIEVAEVDRETPVETGFWYEIKEGFKETLFEIGHGFRAMVIWFVSAIPFIAILVVFGIIIKKIVKTIKTKKSKGENDGGQTDSNSISKQI